MFRDDEDGVNEAKTLLQVGDLYLHLDFDNAKEYRCDRKKERKT